MEDELKWEWGISKVSVMPSSFETFSLSFHVSELMRNSKIEFVQSKCTDLVTLIHLEWPFGRSRAGKWQSEGYFSIYPEHLMPREGTWCCLVHPIQHMERDNILQQVTKNRGWASTLTCAFLLAQKGPERWREGAELAGDRSSLYTQGCSGLKVDACDPGEQLEIWEASDLQGRAWAALWAPFPAIAIDWKNFQLSGSSWSHYFSERLSWMLLRALHHLGCSQ